MRSADRMLADLLEDVAAQTPAPGGGSAAAWTCALAAGLAEMAAAFALTRGEDAEARARMQAVKEAVAELRPRLLELADHDLQAYAPVLQALRLGANDPERERRLSGALSSAAEPPLATAEAGAQVAELAAEVAGAGSPHLRGDAVAGALLAEAGCRAATVLVELNLRRHAGDPRLARAAELAERAARARARALAQAGAA